MLRVNLPVARVRFKIKRAVLAQPLSSVERMPMCLPGAKYEK